MNEAETGGMSNSIPSDTLLSTKLLSLELLYVRFLPLELRSLCSDVKNSLNLLAVVSGSKIGSPLSSWMKSVCCFVDL